MTVADLELAKTAPQKDPHRGKGGAKLWTTAELAKHNGSDPALPLMLVVMGQVFDVSRGKEHCEVPHPTAARDLICRLATTA